MGERHFSNRQDFFISRLIELLHIGTLDSYRVRTHNAHTSVKELHSLIVEWRKNNVKQFDTVASCANEALEKLNADIVYLYDYPFKGILTSYINAFVQSKGKEVVCSRVQQLLEEVLSHMDSRRYVSAIFDKIESLTQMAEPSGETINMLEKDLNEIDMLTSSLCTELIHLGFSKMYLFSCAKGLQYEDSQFEKLFSNFKSAVDPSKLRKYVVVFRVKLGRELKDLELSDLKPTFPDEYKTEFVARTRTNFIRCERNQRFFIVNTDALDHGAAIKSGKEVLSKYLDKIHLAYNFSRIIPDVAVLVLEDRADGYYVVGNQSLPILDGMSTKGNTDCLDLPEKIDSIANSESISKDVINRLSAALRHLRIGDSDTEIEQRFINYWIALEFLFSTPLASDSTFGRIKDNLINILTSCYGRRNIKALDEQIQQVADAVTIPNIWEPDAIKEITDTLDLPILLKYRLHRYGIHLLSGKDKQIRGYLERHKKNVEWQIARIYRLRNELIHEAAIRQEIEGLTSNLRYYLIFVLTNAVVYFSEKAEVSSSLNRTFDMESFFMYYDLLRMSIENHCTLENILNSSTHLDN